MEPKDIAELFDLRGRVAIVTGGTRGIGRAVAEGFAAAGVKVVVASRKADACAETQAALEGRGAEALGVPTHLGDLDAVEALVAATVDRFGAIDILVNNAANALTLPVGQYTEAGWDKSFAVNLRGPMFLVQHALPHLERSDHASIVNVVSAGAWLFSRDVSMYAAGKAALVSFTKSSAAGLAPLGIRVNALGARHGRHRHGAQHPARGPAGHGPRRAARSGRQRRGDGRAGDLPGVGGVELHDRAGAPRRRRSRHEVTRAVGAEQLV